MRARKKPWAAKEIETNEKLVGEPENYLGKWKSIFSNENHIHVEIGCGMGRFIVSMAEKNPHINYIALEREKNVVVTGMRSAKEKGLENVRFIIGDAINLPNYFERGEIKRIYINFCDPWPNRKKWHKRRLTHSGFLEMYENLFNERAELFFKTDNLELFDFSIEQLNERKWSIENLTRDLHSSDYTDNIMTEYEEKFSKKGLPIYRLEAVLLIP